MAAEAIKIRNTAWMETAIGRHPKLAPPILQVLASLAVGESNMEHLRAALDATAELKRRVLAIANSPSYCPVTPIEDAALAAVVLGQRQLMGMTLAFGIHAALGDGASCHGHDDQGMLVHGLATAATGWAVAEQCGLPSEICGRIYVAGLFHDLGKAILAQRWPTLDLSATPDHPPGLAELEDEQLGVDHVRASVLLAEHWGVDPEVVELIADHHSPGTTNPARQILHFADHMAAVTGLGFAPDVPLEVPLDADALAVFQEFPEFLIAGEESALQEGARATMTLGDLL